MALIVSMYAMLYKTKLSMDLLGTEDFAICPGIGNSIHNIELEIFFHHGKNRYYRYQYMFDGLLWQQNRVRQEKNI
ncbi:hypothetical protein D3C86_1792710 [compost metagenome]